MKRNIFKYFIAASVVALSVQLSSCVGDLDMEPIDPSVTQNFNQDMVFAKIYSSLTLTGQEGPAGDGDVAGIDEGFSAFTRLIWNMNELTSDEAACSWGDLGIPELNFNRWTENNDFTKGLYGRFYFNITLCNHFLQQTEGMTDDKSVKQRAEARFMRALNYYYLLDMFGNVPFTEVVAIDPPKQILRKDLFKWIEEELKACESDMYEPRQAPYYRVDKAANWLLTSRLYLNGEVYTAIPQTDSTTAAPGQTYWNEAAIYAKKVMDSGYSLSPNYKHLFMADNAGTLDGSAVNTAPQEIIFPIACDGVKTKSWGASLFLIASMYKSDMNPVGTKEAWSGNKVRSSLIRKFFPTSIYVNDLRDLTTGKTSPSSRYVKDDRALFFAVGRTLEMGAEDDANGLYDVGTFDQGYSSTKWTNVRADGGVTSDNQFTDTDIPFMRLAEAYMIYAEAVQRGATADGMTALEAVNVLRDRAHAKVLTALDLDVLCDEWAREFNMEGRRRMDLIRFNKYGGADVTYTWPWKGGRLVGTNFDAKYNLFAIPASDLNANPNLKQNPGY